MTCHRGARITLTKPPNYDAEFELELMRRLSHVQRQLLGAHDFLWMGNTVRTADELRALARELDAIHLCMMQLELGVPE